MISFISATVAFLLATFVAYKDRRSLANRSFIAGLMLLALIEVFRGLNAGEAQQEMLDWQGVRLWFFALAPGAFLIFSLSFARQEYRKYLARWKYILCAFFSVPIIALLLPEPVFKEIRAEAAEFIPLGYSGKIFYSFILLSAVVILANLERTLRASTGRIRWQIKFILLGIGAICAVWIYTSSQALIYSALDTSLSILHPMALLAASVFFGWGLFRSRFLNVDVYLSRTTIQYSLTAILASVYLLILGLLAFQIRYFNSSRSLPLDALLVLLALALLAVLLLSDRLQERMKRVVTRHFQRPLYDYRKAWMELTENTNSLVDIEDLCSAIARIVSKTFSILSVNVWLCDDAKERLSLAGSTVFTRSQAADLERSGESVSQLLRTIEKDALPIDLSNGKVDWANDIMCAKPEYFADFRMRTILPIRTGGQLVGILTLNEDRVGKAPISMEDHDLLNAYTAQLAARVLQLKLSENLRKAQEIQAFQQVSTFFVHDLKNLASRLSLTMQNLPAYFDNPEFRDDALKLIGESAAKIDDTISRLSSLKQIEIKPVAADLNSLIETVLADFERSARFSLKRDLGRLPPVLMDPEQIQKVVTNLVLNAHDAIRGQGSIRVATAAIDHQAVLTVTDNGCGMSRQYVDKMLFRPFHSTKKRGMGIGLFHSKMIVEAHHGKIEVESEEGKGTTFRVILPF
jgi:putative PEP-CTERM system histidine kinase